MSILSIISGIVIPIAKFLIGMGAKKKLSDKEFVAIILAHQNKKGLAGEAALNFEAALEQAMKELDQAEAAKSDQEDSSHKST